MERGQQLKALKSCHIGILKTMSPCFYMVEFRQAVHNFREMMWPLVFASKESYMKNLVPKISCYFKNKIIA
jgi:hypothetical protein